MTSLLNNSQPGGKPTNGYNTFETEERPKPATSDMSWASRLLFSFATPLMQLGSTRQLETDDLWALEPSNQSAEVSNQLAQAYEARAGSSSRLLRSVVATYGPGVALCGVSTLFSTACSLFAPIVLNRVISALEATELDLRSLMWWLGAFFASRVVDALLSTQAAWYIGVIGIRATASLRMLLFRKVLRRKGNVDDAAGAELANLLTSDTRKLSISAQLINNLWAVPIQLTAIVYMLYWVLGVAAFAGLAIVILSMVTTYAISKYQLTYFAKMLRYRDERMRSIREVFGAIQTVKFNAWEGKFAERIANVRADELRELRTFLVVAASETFTVWATPLVVSTVSFAIYVLVLERALTAATVFTAITLFNALREPLQNFPDVVQIVLMSKVSLDRMDTYLSLPEYDADNVEVLSGSVDAELAVEVKNASFSWSAENSAPLVLRDVNASIKKGDFTVVYGDVGAGKSSLCSALLGELDKREGLVRVRGRVAYYSQQPWIQNMSVRDNILFGNPFDDAKYRRVLDACGLLPDLQQLPAGDATEIGHGGINLSGGQKARISLARACYSDADVFILDSPLAAVDARVKGEIFSKCFGSLLKAKTLILVTHNSVVINSEVVNVKIHVSNGAVRVDRRSDATDRSEASASVFLTETADDIQAPSPSSPEQQQSGKLVQEEKREQGRVSKQVFWVYFQSLGGFKMCLLVVVTQLLWQAFQISSDLWLTHWTSEASAAGSESHARDMTIYSILAAAGAAMVFVRSVTVMLVGIRGARHLFDVMTRALLHAPLRFFDANPIGRITNRYSADISAIDVRMPLIFGMVIGDMFATVCQLATAAYAIKLLGVLVIPLVWVYVRVADFYLDSFREVSRLQNVAVSPVLSLVSQCEAGLPVIRAFGSDVSKRMVSEMALRLDAASRVAIVSTVTEQWYVVRIQLIGCAVLIGVVSALVYLRAAISPGLVGLSFAYALNVNAGLANIVHHWSLVEVAMVSPERVMEYASVEPENNRQALVVEPAEAWPAHGAITFERVVFRYKEDGLPVLKDVSFSINSKEKVGIVGRTGAGKSSLTMALFRINELSSGRIFIDGVDIASLPLQTLRSRLSIIPQSPVLFKGALRAYIDPFDEFDDADIWASLAKVGMREQVLELKDRLLFELSENGDNFSVGERQLLCMSRALLTRSRIVVMDEATASIDHATERKLQEMIARDFEGATVVTIAHRLSTVLESDRVLVMDDGCAVEFDSPKKLAQDPNGVFSRLVKDGGYLESLSG